MTFIKLPFNNLVISDSYRSEFVKINQKSLIRERFFYDINYIIIE